MADYNEQIANTFKRIGKYISDNAEFFTKNFPEKTSKAEMRIEIDPAYCTFEMRFTGLKQIFNWHNADSEYLIKYEEENKE